jgi:uncharacterized protein YndB with AHSA1/START domain
VTGAADREILAETVVAATPAEVWRVLGDVRRMPELSPELVRMLPLKPGGLRRGQWYLGINRRGIVVWPTRSVLTDVEPGRLLAWDTASSGARWVWELAPHSAGTRVVHRRPVPRRLTVLARVFATVFLGGASGHTDNLENDMARSVANLRRTVEAGH